MKVTIVGTGYVGLVTGAGFADVGVDVTCVDVNEEKIKLLLDGKVPFYEPGLEDLLKRNVEKSRLQFSTDLGSSVKGADAVFLAVGTPMAENGAADLSYIMTAAKQVSEAATGPLVLVTKSTVPVGTAEKIRAVVDAHATHPISVASNPEFLKEGDAVNDFLKPDRIVVGADDDKARGFFERLYRPFMMREYKVIRMGTKSAELTKYAANGMLATRISFMNEVANLCEKVGADVDAVRKGISSDRRIGKSFLYPGVGYGGSCFPKDVRALIYTASEHGNELKILKSVDEVNLTQRGVLLEKLLNAFGGDLKGKTFAVWGLSFKPRTDDMREAPSIPVIEGILAAGGRVRAYDRAAKATAREVFGDRIIYCEDEYAALDGASALLLLTEWAEFRMPNWGEVKDRMAGNHIFDGRNIYNPAALTEQGFVYEGIGRKV
ncbi:MAG: UDP-glucose 6-dehydrogenase [Myxococcales bacterium]|nr:UDP-glucose 6-dehydrogenase [Myxococcales bacterium]